MADNANDLVTFANVTVTKEENNFYAVSGEDKVQVYNKFHIAAYEEGFDAFVGTDEYNITGILEAYNTSFEICPIEDGVVTGINEVTTASEENGAMYNVAGQRVDSAYKGIVIMNGKKMIQK